MIGEERSREGQLERWGKRWNREKQKKKYLLVQRPGITPTRAIVIRIGSIAMEKRKESTQAKTPINRN